MSLLARHVRLIWRQRNHRGNAKKIWSRTSQIIAQISGKTPQTSGQSPHIGGQIPHIGDARVGWLVWEWRSAFC